MNTTWTKGGKTTQTVEINSNLLSTKALYQFLLTWHLWSAHILIGWSSSMTSRIATRTTHWS